MKSGVPRYSRCKVALLNFVNIMISTLFGGRWKVAVSVVDCFEFRSINFASVFDQRIIILLEKRLFIGISFKVFFISHSTHTRAGQWCFSF